VGDGSNRLVVPVVRILGVPAIVDGGRERLITGQVGLLLTALALETNRIVPTEQLIDRLWPDEPPGLPANALQALVSRLRKRLGHQEVRILGTSAGYKLAADPHQVDLYQFRQLVRRGFVETEERRTVEAQLSLRSALDLITGALGSGLKPVAFVHGAREGSRKSGERRCASTSGSVWMQTDRFGCCPRWQLRYSTPRLTRGCASCR
jgi:DNA-binding winged helix-turn-helix (wHTH) protein